MSVEVVAVDTDPTVWQAFCEKCDKYVSETFAENKGKDAEKIGLVHLAKYHPEYVESF